MTRNFWNNRTLDSFARHIAPVLNDIAEEDESRTYGNRVYDMSFTSEGKDALERFYAETCGELSDEDITYLEAVCNETDTCEEELFQWVLSDSSYIELDEGCTTDAGEYRRLYIYLNELLWKEAHGKDRLSKTVYDIIDEATANWKDAQDYCSC